MTDAPLYARRRARGYARYYLSANILEYPTELTIGLREVGPDATLVTFDYVLEHGGGLSFKGDQHTLTREAEAIIALASWDKDASSCSSCETAQISEARFAGSAVHLPLRGSRRNSRSYGSPPRAVPAII